MGSFKRFTDFCGGIALFVASFFLFREYMAYTPDGEPALREKIKLFLSETAWRDYRPYLWLVGLLALSLLVGIVLRRLPSVCFAFVALPFLHALWMFRDGTLYERPMLYLLFTLLPLAGNLFDALSRDAEDGRHRAFALANVSSLLVLLFFVLLIWRCNAVMDADVSLLKPFDRDIFFGVEELDVSFWKYFAAAYAVGIVVSLLFLGAYWIDLLLAAAPLIPAMKRQLMGTFGPHSDLVLALMIACLVCRLAVMIIEPPQNKKVRPRRNAPKK